MFIEILGYSYKENNIFWNLIMVTSAQFLFGCYGGIVNAVVGNVYRYCQKAVSVEECVEKISNAWSLKQMYTMPGIGRTMPTTIVRTGPEFTCGVIGAIAGYKALDNLVSLYHTLQNPQIRVAEKVRHSFESVFIVGLSGTAAVFMFSL